MESAITDAPMPSPASADWNDFSRCPEPLQAQVYTEDAGCCCFLSAPRLAFHFTEDQYLPISLKFCKGISHTEMVPICDLHFVNSKLSRTVWAMGITRMATPPQGLVASGSLWLTGPWLPPSYLFLQFQQHLFPATLHLVIPTILPFAPSLVTSEGITLS